MRGLYLILILYAFLHNVLSADSNSTSSTTTTTEKTVTAKAYSSGAKETSSSSKSASNLKDQTKSKSQASASASASTTTTESSKFRSNAKDFTNEKDNEFDDQSDFNTQLLQPPKQRRFRRPFQRNNNNNQFQNQRPWRQQQQQQSNRFPNNNQGSFTPEQQQQAFNAILAAATLALQNQLQYAPFYNALSNGSPVKYNNLPSSLNSVTSSNGKFPFPPHGSQASLLYAPNYMPTPNPTPSTPIIPEPSPFDILNKYNSQPSGQYQIAGDFSYPPEIFSQGSPAFSTNSQFPQPFSFPPSSSSPNFATSSFHPSNSLNTVNGNGLPFLGGPTYSPFVPGKYSGRIKSTGRPAFHPGTVFPTGLDQSTSTRGQFTFVPQPPPGTRFSNPTPTIYQQFSPSDYPLEIAKSYYQQSVALPPAQAPRPTEDPPVQQQKAHVYKVPQFSTPSSSQKNVGHSSPSSQDLQQYYSSVPQSSNADTFTPTYTIEIKSQTHEPVSGKTIQYHYATPKPATSPYKPYSVTLEPSKFVSPDIYSTNQLFAQSEKYFKSKFNDDALSPQEFLKSFGHSSPAAISSPKLNPFTSSEQQLSTVLKFEPYLKSGAIAPDSVYPENVDTSKYFYPSSTPSSLLLSEAYSSKYHRKPPLASKPSPSSYSSYKSPRPQRPHQQYSSGPPTIRNNVLEPEDAAYYSTSSNPTNSYPSYSSSNPYNNYQFLTSSAQSPSLYSYPDLSASDQNLSDLIANPSVSSDGVSPASSYLSGSVPSSNSYSPSSSHLSSGSIESNPNLIISAPVIYYPNQQQQQQQQKQQKSRLGNILSNIQGGLKKLMSS